jgi:amino acid adenylation domain-containing protein
MLHDDFAPELILTVSALANELAFSSATILCLDEPCPDAAVVVDAIDTHALAYIIYTSGSTGAPKGVLVEHAQVLHLWRALQHTVVQGIEDGSRVALNAELTFDAAWQGIVQLLSGHTLIIVPAVVRNDPAALRAFLDEQRIDVFDCTPAQLEPLLAVRGDLGVKHVLVGGEAISVSLWQRLAGLPDSAVHNVYGPTECTVDSTFATVVGTVPTIGRPLPNVRTYVLDAFHQPLPVGVAGQLYVGGEGVARGYLDRSSLTAERFLADPFAVDGGRMYATGDLARWRADGMLEYIGRTDHQVKLRGYRIEPGEIEACLAACAGVHEALVLLREDADGDRRLAAYLVPVDGCTPEPGDLRKALLAVLPEPMVPASFTVLVEWPLTAHGKVDRRALPVPAVSAVAAAQFAAPVSHTERRIAAIWHDLLHVAPIGRDDNFFDLGGHSLAAVRLHEAVRVSLASDISLTDVFQAATLAELAATIDRRSAGQS